MGEIIIIKLRDKIKSIGKKKIIIMAVSIVFIVSIVAILSLNKKVTTLSLVTLNENVDVRANEEIIVSGVLSSLPQGKYPAASASIEFDKNKLEFVEVTIGTMQVYDNFDENTSEDKSYKIPQWTYDVEAANRDGIINIMYLDMTAGKNAYSNDGFEKNTKDIAFRLVFKAKDSCISGEKLEVSIADAVFATVTGEEDKTSISTKSGYSKLKVKSTNIKIK